MQRIFNGLNVVASTDNQMTDEELKTELTAKNALVVHFSHHAKMREKGVFPEDLQYAIKNQDNLTLSCCVLWPNHGMDLPGSVGIIVSPRVVNVVSVSNTDSGSMRVKGGGICLAVRRFQRKLLMVHLMSKKDTTNGALVALQ